MFETYSREIFDQSRAWVAERDIFEGGIGHLDYDQSVVGVTTP